MGQRRDPLSQRALQVLAFTEEEFREDSKQKGLSQRPRENIPMRNLCEPLPARVGRE